MEVLKNLFERYFHTTPDSVQPLHGELGGSGRAILRLSVGAQTAIGILSSVLEENRAFLDFSRHFRQHGLPVPAIYAEDLTKGAYLEEDLGDTTLYQFLSANRRADAISPQVIDAYRSAVALLPRFQVDAGRDLNYKVCYPRSSFDRQSIAWDLNYFKYYFLRLAGIPFNEQALEDDFGRLTRFLLTAPRDYFLYRDFQSRNIMIRDGKPFFLDYQGGRKGALQYDIASLLYDGKADLPPALRQQLLDHYLDALDAHISLDRGAFMEHYYAYVYVRIMQALGAYGFRGFFERKPHFLQSVPYALKNLRWLAENVRLPIALPALDNAFEAMIASPKFQSLAAPAPPLTVRIFSFSFHREAPTDPSGNGGGFVFDARSLPNPGRQEQFRALTGQDAPVIDYLRQQESVHQFFAAAQTLVDSAVAAYQQRGFQNLMVSFGCTGGQHRSVFLAEQLADHLRTTPGVEVLLRHVELEKRTTEQASPMKAMILAAGLGTRLRPLTNDRPKALVEVAGRTLLDLALARLRSFGIFEVIINTHHHGETIADYLDAHRNFGMSIALSPEPILLDTGGGLKNAASFFLESGLVDSGPNPTDFVVHNVDILSTIDITQMLRQHTATGALATIAVQSRASSRQLLFDSAGQLCGRQISGATQMVRPAADPQAQAFSCIHILSTRIFQKLTEQGPFPIIDAYLRLAAEGEKILAFQGGDAYWRDLGRPESIDQATHDIATGQYAAP